MDGQTLLKRCFVAPKRKQEVEKENRMKGRKPERHKNKKERKGEGRKKEGRKNEKP